MSFPPSQRKGAPPPPLDAHVERLVTLWRSVVHAPARRVGIAVALATFLCGAHVARLGTGTARVAAAASLVVVIAIDVALRVRRERALRDLTRVLRSVVMRADRAAGERALRALALVEKTRVDRTAGSVELASLHLSRVVGGVSEARLRKAAETVARRLQLVAMVASMAALLAVALGPFRLIEGLDVLVARDRVAPLPFTYLDDVQVEIHPPDYLREKDRRIAGLTQADAPFGSLVTVRGRPAHAGRRLVLRGGDVEVPFVDDGKGGVTARWPLGASITLQVAAKHGDVWIEQGEPLPIRSIPDQSPVVKVDKAPRVVKLMEESEIPVVYNATDDHGLREVDLVLRAGGQEERRILSKLDGETRSDSGGTTLRSGDRFLRGTYLPVEVTVEAKDNDPLTGPKWGRSEAITLVPPAIGEPEALRYEALVSARDALVDLLASRVTAKVPKDPKAAKEHALDEEKRLQTATSAVEAALVGRFGTLRIPSRLSTFAAGQLRKLREAMKEEKSSATPASHEKSLKASEGAALAIDSAVRGMGARDAAAAAKRLSRVASDAADGLQQAASRVDVARGRQRADAALSVIEPSGKAIARLGTLGEDLGAIVAGDLRRIRRALAANDLVHAELAARDLATRLAKPVPSFMGGGRGGGAEGGGGGAPQPGDEPPDDAGESFDAEEQALQEIAREHAGNIEDVQQALHDAAGEGGESLLDEARKRAATVRELAEKLPRSGEGEGAKSPSETAQAEAERMAEALERGDLRDAAEAGQRAEKALEDAKKNAPGEDDGDAPSTLSRMQKKAAARAAREAEGKLSPEVRWAEEALEKMKKRMQEHAKLGEAAEREGRLSDRTKGLEQRGRGKEGAMSDTTSELLKRAEQRMQDAARSLKKGDAEKALEEQREAQRMLEMAKQAGEEQPSSEGDGPDGKGDPSGPLPIPKAEEHKGPDEFRRRVQEGMGKGLTPSLKDSVRRYTERLLR